MNSEIVKFINNEQRGKSGIYPNRLIESVQLKFGITREEARNYVLQHIREVK
uniref:Uncharacterized protein n=1 Tax=viral metagenome TaxID=1070528 RepID=A0A6M3LU96_9ZZZZ